MKFKQLLKQTEKLITDNSPMLLTSIGVAGTVGTAILASRASFKAAEVLQEHEAMLQYAAKDVNDSRQIYGLDDIKPEIVPLSLKQKAKLVWPLYIPSIATGTCTIAAIVFANRIGTRRAAAIAAAYSVSEKAFTEYKDKVVEVIGEKKEEKLRGEIAQAQVDATSPGSGQVIVVNGDVLCLESYTGRYFKSSYENIRNAENTIGAEVINNGFASLGDFYTELGLPRTSDCEEVGWTTDKMPKIDISACVAEDNKPCLVMAYTVVPIRNYHRFH